MLSILLLVVLVLVAILVARSPLEPFDNLSAQEGEHPGGEFCTGDLVNSGLTEGRKEEDHFRTIWNGSYVIPGGELVIDMKDQNHGIVDNGITHWLVRSYGPTVLTGDSYDKSYSIFIEYLGDWRKCCEKMPRIKVLYTNNKSGDVKSPWGDNLDMYAVKKVPNST